MTKNLQKLMIILLAMSLLAVAWLGSPVQAQTPATERPLLYIVDYSTDTGGAVSPWSSFGLTFTLGNNGKLHAHNIVMTFQSEEFVSQDGGVFTTYEVDANNVSNETHTHHFKVNDLSTWKYSGTIQAITTYTDPAGTPYSDTFTFSITIDQPAAPSPTKTPTPSAMNRPQLVVSGYGTDITPLQPGSTFKLSVDVVNLGNSDARSVSLVYGGGVSLSSNEQGTPSYSGVSGTSGDLVNFAPIGKSNVILLGDMPVNAQIKAEQDFIVNVSTVPGAYPLKVSLVYTDLNGTRMVDDQVITLLVYSLPQLEISFYRDPGMISANMMTSLPIQVTNLAKKTVVLGNMTIGSESGEIENGTSLVGTLDPGGYYTFDVNYLPYTEGPATLAIVINYTDDFNQLQVYQSSLDVEVLPAMEIPETPIQGEAMPPEEPAEPTGFWARIWSAIKGFLGIGTGTKTPTEVSTEDLGTEPQIEIEPIPRK